MARNQRFRRANSHVRQMRLGNLHIDRNEISPECIYRFLRICEPHLDCGKWQKCVWVSASVLLLFRIDLSEMQTRNRMVFTWIRLARKMCTPPRLRHLNNPWYYRIWNECKWDIDMCRERGDGWCAVCTCICAVHSVGDCAIAQLIVPPLRWNARFIAALKFIWMANGASGRIFAFIFIVRIGIDVTVERGRQHFRWCHYVCTSLQNRCRAIETKNQKIEKLKSKEWMAAIRHTFANAFARHEWSHSFWSTFWFQNSANKLMRSHRALWFDQILEMLQILWRQRFRCLHVGQIVG